jgi:hypothetical protein
MGRSVNPFESLFGRFSADDFMITSDTQRERTVVQLEGFRRELEGLDLDQSDKRSVTLRANYKQVIKQLEDELREYDDLKTAS